jgi:hypothetical protein
VAPYDKVAEVWRTDHDLEILEGFNRPLSFSTHSQGQIIFLGNPKSKVTELARRTGMFYL